MCTTHNAATDNLRHVSRQLLQHGVTSYCPTLISLPPSQYRTILPTIARHCLPTAAAHRPKSDNMDGANMLGIHLEGPFFARNKHGAHSTHYISVPWKGILSLDEVYGTNFATQNTNEENVNGSSSSELDAVTSKIRIITLAPELHGSSEILLHFSRQSSVTCSDGSSNVVVSMGHTNATYVQARQAVSLGATLTTHLYNAMTSFHHRDAGVIGVALGFGASPEEELNGKYDNGSCTASQSRDESSSPFYSLIVDGIHSSPAAIRMAYNANPNKLVLVTDAISAMGMKTNKNNEGTGQYYTLGEHVQVELIDHATHRTATISNTSTLAGSVGSMEQSVRLLREYTRCGTEYALLCATLHPAQVLQIQDKRGCIDVNRMADLVLLDEEKMEVLKTWVNGRLVFEKGDTDR